MQNLGAKIQEVQLENGCLEKTCKDLESEKSDWECQFGKLREEIKILQEAQQQTKLELHRVIKEKKDLSKTSQIRYNVLERERNELRDEVSASRAKELELRRESEEKEDLSKASIDRCNVLERECNDLRGEVSALHVKELGLEEKLSTLFGSLEESAANLEEKDEIQGRLEELLSEERITVQQLEDEKFESMRKITSMSVVHARLLLECEKDKKAAQEECLRLNTDMALTTAENCKLAGVLGAVEEELGQVREEHKRSEYKIEELLVIQDDSKYSSGRQIAELMDHQKILKTENECSNRIRFVL
jgi:chromosome segregation ATPase